MRILWELIIRNIEIFITEALDVGDSANESINSILKERFKKSTLLSISDIEQVRNYHFRVLDKTKDQLDSANFIKELRKVNGINSVNLIFK